MLDALPMDHRWETILHGAGAMRPALIEAAFRERAIWLNMCRQLGIKSSQADSLWAYISATYQPDGTIRDGGTRTVQPSEVDPAIVASVATFARVSIRDGDRSGVDRRNWVIDVPLPYDRRLVLSLQAASGLDGVAQGLPCTH